MRVVPFLLPIFLGCSAQDVEYGVDVSFPIHREKVSSNYPWLPHNVKDGVETPPEHVAQPLQPLGDRQAFYNHLLEGCAKKHDADRCNFSEQQRIERNLMRPSAMVNFTTMGFSKIPTPPDLWQYISEFWKRNGNNNDNWTPERWEYGESTVNHWESPTYMVSLHNSSLVGGGRDLERAIWNAAQTTLEGWTGQKLRGCSLYGIRVYTEGSILHTHVDRLPLVSSAILNVAQDTDEPWPLEVIGHDGKAHNITMEPGEMVLYESHSILHGRPFPLKGKYMANIFVHFEPITEKEGEFPPYIQPTATGTQFYREMMAERQAERRNPEQLVVSTLVHTLAGSGRLEDLKRVVEDDPRSVHSEDKSGWTPLHEAARGGHIENMHYLLQKGANINAITHKGATPMFIAERYLGADSASLTFLQSKGGIRKEALEIPQTLPHTLAGDGKIVQLRELVEKNERIVHLPDDHGWTPLHEAARGGHIPVVEYLLQKGAALNGQTRAGGTPLYYAAKYLGKESDMYQFLKSLGSVYLGPDL